MASSSHFRKRENTGLSKKVCQIDPSTGEIANIYDSISAVAKSLGISTKVISDTLRGRQRTAGGFYWQDYSE